MKLTPEARALIEDARPGERPLAAVRSRVRSRVLSRIAAGAAAGSVATLGASGAAATTTALPIALVKWGVIVGIAGAVGVTAARYEVHMALVPRPPAAASAQANLEAPRVPAPARYGPTPPVTEPAAASVANPGNTAAPEAPAVTTPPEGLVSARRPAPGRSSATAPPPAGTGGRGSLEAETGLLEAAQSALRDGHPDRALSALDEHDSKYKEGVLREERLASRVLALCALGRTEEARAEARRFLIASPRSPMAERVRSSCGGSGAP